MTKELKTLKDIEKVTAKTGIFTPNIADGNRMAHIAISEDLRTEAIKWVKELNKYATDSDYAGEIIPPDILGEGHCKQCDAIVLLHFIKHFFNINQREVECR